MSGIQLVMASSLLVGCGMVSMALWFFSRRYLGEIAVLQAPCSRPQLQFSTLDFWGNREVSSCVSSGAVTSLGPQVLTSGDPHCMPLFWKAGHTGPGVLCCLYAVYLAQHRPTCLYIGLQRQAQLTDMRQ